MEEHVHDRHLISLLDAANASTWFTVSNSPAVVRTRRGSKPTPNPLPLLYDAEGRPFLNSRQAADLSMRHFSKIESGVAMSWEEFAKVHNNSKHSIPQRLDIANVPTPLQLESTFQQGNPGKKGRL